MGGDASLWQEYWSAEMPRKSLTYPDSGYIMLNKKLLGAF
jgi:hypothetical protein